MGPGSTFLDSGLSQISSLFIMLLYPLVKKKTHLTEGAMSGNYIVKGNFVFG